MSIYASLRAPADDSKNILDYPLVYQGSHVMPEESDERGGYVDIALIPAHVRYYRESTETADLAREPDGHEPFLRFGVNEATVVLTKRNVEMVYATLGEWLKGLSEA